MNCPIKETCENYTPTCELNCKEFDEYQHRKVDEFRKNWRIAHPILNTVIEMLLAVYLVWSFLCVIQVIGMWLR